MSIKCKKCSSNKWVKNGFAWGVQKYRYKECGINFVKRNKRQKYGLADKLKVIKLYLENCAIRTIESLTGIRNSQVSAWIEEATDNIKSELRIAENSVNDIAILELD